MKFLLHGNSPTVKTGYGIQIGQLAECLQADGHDVACSSTYGIQGTVETWRGIRVYGCGYDTNSNDRIHMHADHFFAGDPGWIITCVDVWALKNPLLAEYNVAAWVPIDHFLGTGPQPNVCEFFRLTSAVPVAMSHFGEALLLRAGLDPAYVPLAVDTSVFKPTDQIGGITPRQMIGVPDDAFVVGMVAMNKGWAKDRKGFNEAFWAFSMLAHEHDDAYFYVHADRWGGAEGQDLVQLANNCGIPEHRLIWGGGAGQYGYYVGYSPEMMAAVYNAMDVLLAPSHGEGFCVPLVEAQACGTPVIATDFSSQTELVTAGCGWLVQGQPEWDPAHQALYKCPLIDEVIGALETAYKVDRNAMVEDCVRFAADYDVQHVYANYWRPFIEQLTAKPERLELDREPMPDKDAVAVLCPIYKRTEHIAPLISSFLMHTKPHETHLYLIVDRDDEAVQAAWKATAHLRGSRHDIVFMAQSGAVSCAEKWNYGYQQTIEPWVLCIGDDVRFYEGWLDAARKLSSDFDVIGTNDSVPPRTRNPKVAKGVHADHFFVRRAYVEEYGASLDGPGVLAPDAYRHWYVDMEIVRLARARGVFTPCLDSIVEHLHPGYDGDEQARRADPTYMIAVDNVDSDERTFKERVPLIEMQRTSRAKA